MSRAVQRSVVAAFAVTWVGALALAPVVRAADLVLAGYEPSESPELTVTSPDAGMTLSWPLVAGAGGVPEATEGSHVLKLDWSGQPDRKVEVRHDWATATFDLAGSGAILLDVYVETASALPAIAGIYDDVFYWLEGFDLPTTTGQWTTLAMCVADKEHIGLDHILATLFEQVAGDDGILYLDNLRLVPPKQITFAGRDWTVKCGGLLGPGPNPFSQSEENVWVDGNGRLHLKITGRRGPWWCAEVVLDDPVGFGTYTFEVETNVDGIDTNAVLGLFTYDYDAVAENHREIDLEFSRWGDAQNDNGQFVVQPYFKPDNIHRFDVDYAGAGGNDTTTHTWVWGPDAIDFESRYGAVPGAASIESWSYTGADIPDEGDEQVRMNLWLFQGSGPAGAQAVEVIVSDFRFIEAPQAVPALGPGWLLGMVLALAGSARAFERTGRGPREPVPRAPSRVRPRDEACVGATRRSRDALSWIGRAH